MRIGKILVELFSFADDINFELLFWYQIAYV